MRSSKQYTRIFLALLVLLIPISCSKDSSDPTDVEYTYQVPEQLDDGWVTASLEDVGVDIDKITAMMNYIYNGEYDFIHSILIVKEDKLVFEQYLNGYNRTNAHNIKSVSKSIMSALVGIAFRENFLDSLNRKMLDFYPEYVTPNMDSTKYAITIEHLLMMKAGFDHEENNYLQVYNSDNWIRNTIELPLLYPPGERFRYNTFQCHLVSGIITKATGMSTRDFANQYLMEPLGITIRDWDQDPQGIYFGGNNMFFSARDIARFGLLYLKNGAWENEQIVPAEWVETSTADHTGFSDRTWGDLHDWNYGYWWWLGKINDYESYLAIGHGGQFIINIPELNMVVTATSESNVDLEIANQQELSVLAVVANYILPAVAN